MSLSPQNGCRPTRTRSSCRVSDPIAIGVERDALDEWVNTGGHLVLLPPRNSTFLTDNLLEHFGFGLYEIVTCLSMRLTMANRNRKPTGTIDGTTKYDYTVDLDTTLHRLQHEW